MKCSDFDSGADLQKFHKMTESQFTQHRFFGYPQQFLAVKINVLHNLLKFHVIKIASFTV